MTSISLPGQPGLEPSTSRGVVLFGTVRRGDDGSFGRRLLRLAPFVIALHLAAVAAILTIRPLPRVVLDDAPKVVFLRAVPQAAPAAPRAPAAPPKQKATPKRQARVVPPKVIPQEMPPETPPPVEAAQPSEAPPTEAIAASGPASTSTHGLGGSGDAPVGVGEITRAPDVLFSPRPTYPQSAKSMGITGTVVVRVVVDIAGRVEAGSAKIMRSVPALDASAMEAISRWRFSGSRGRDGRPVRVILDVPIAFSLR